MTKNSIQIVHEILSIQPIKFNLVETSGPSHKPTFRFRLTITMGDACQEFFSEANSVKIAKKLAAVSCLQFLIAVRHIEETDATFVKAAIDSDLKTITGDKSLEEFLNNHPKEASTKTPVISNQEKEPTDFSFSSKTLEVIATKNKLSILNHMLQCVDFSFEDLTEETNPLGVTTTFRVELRIVKNERFIEKYGSLKERVVNNALCSVDSNEYRLLGTGPSKKTARLRAAQLALENIFGIQVEDSGKSLCK